MKLTAFGAPGIQEMIVIFFILAMLALPVWGIVHCVNNKKLSDTNRIISIVLMVVLGPIGVAIYFFMPRENQSSADSNSEKGE